MRRSRSTQAQSTASHCRLTTPRESDCSRMDSKVSSDWLQSYVKATRPVLELFKMAGYFSDSPRIASTLSAHLTNCLSKLCTCLPDWFTDQMIDSLSTQVNKLVDSLCSSSRWALWVVKANISSKTAFFYKCVGIWGSYSGMYRNCDLSGCDASSFGKWLPVFRRNPLCPP